MTPNLIRQAAQMIETGCCGGEEIVRALRNYADAWDRGARAYGKDRRKRLGTAPTKGCPTCPGADEDADAGDGAGAGENG